MSNRVADALLRNFVLAMSVLYIQKADAPPEAGCNIDIGWLQRGDVDILPIFEYFENNIPQMMNCKWL